MLHDLETLCSIPAADVAGGLVAIQNMQKKVLLFVFFFFFFLMMTSTLPWMECFD